MRIVTLVLALSPLLVASGSCGGGALADTAPAPDPNAPIDAGVEKVEVMGEGRVAGGAPTSFVTVILAAIERRTQLCTGFVSLYSWA